MRYINVRYLLTYLLLWKGALALHPLFTDHLYPYIIHQLQKKTTSVTCNLHLSVYLNNFPEDNSESLSYDQPKLVHVTIIRHAYTVLIVWSGGANVHAWCITQKCMCQIKGVKFSQPPAPTDFPDRCQSTGGRSVLGVNEKQGGIRSKRRGMVYRNSQMI